MSSKDESFSEVFSRAEEQDEFWTELASIEFTEDLARWMEERRVSRAELAQSIGTSQPYISKVLKGNVNFTLASMVKLSRALGLRVRIRLEPEEGAASRQRRSEPDHDVSADLAPEPAG
jgi:transcriptional regulator with XRE-family HTH domain